MTVRNPATGWARALVDELARAGVTDLCLAPGSRSTPLVLAASGAGRFRLRVFVDERSAAFFALGLGRATGRPAAVITTSGTAVANLMPAVVEASWSEVPLLLVTADRPPRLRDADANQAIDQVRIFGRYVRMDADLGPPLEDERALRHLRALASRAVAASLGLPAGPVHLNAPFDKPLEPVPADDEAESAAGLAHHGPDASAPGHPPHSLAGRPEGAPWTRIARAAAHPDPADLERLATLVRKAERGVVVAGPHPEARTLGPALRRFAAAAGFPLLADPLSGGRFGAGGGVVPARYDLVLRSPDARRALDPDLVIRVGRSPTSAALLEWLDGATDARQVVIDAGARWKDHLARAAEAVPADPVATLDALAGRLGGGTGGAGGGEAGNPSGEAAAGDGEPDPWPALWQTLDRAATEAVARALDAAEGVHEGAVLARVVEALPAGTPLFVSSSMPVRDLDAYGGTGQDAIPVFGNRGASGIDGIVSGALGVAAGAERTAVAILGDLALLHDVGGLLAAREPDAAVVFVVVNNDGGGIFHMLPIREREPAFTPYFATPHGLDLSHAAALFGLPHRRLEGLDEVAPALGEALEADGSVLLEIRTDREANRAEHERVAEAVRAAVARVLEEA